MGIERAFGMDTSLGDPNSLAATIVYTLPLIFYYFTDKTSKWIKIFLAFTSLILLWCVILTGSRTGMAGVIVFGLLLLWERKNKIRNFILIAILFIGIVSVMPEQDQPRLLSLTEMSEEVDDETGAAASARSRLEFLGYAFEMLLDRPLFGYGLGNFSVAMGDVYEGLWLAAHTLPAQLMGEMGLTGIIAFVTFVVFMFGHLRRFRWYFKKTGNKFFYNMTLAMKNHLLLLFFMGVGGHNLNRYNWYIIAAIIVLMMRPQISGYGIKSKEELLAEDEDNQEFEKDIERITEK
jgi:O-antigen ligase